MIKYLKEYRFYIILFLFLLIPIISLDTSNRLPRDYRLYDRFFVTLTAPVQMSITWTLDSLVSLFQNYVFLVHTRDENLLLLQENRKLLNEIVDLKETQQENTRLRQLLDFRETHELKTIMARVIAYDVSSEFRAIRINRGELDGIRANMAVINSEGVVGRVLRTTKQYSDIVTILDLLSAVDAIVERSRVQGIVEGMSDDVCQLKYALRTDDIQEGDLLISSGLDGVFPKGIAVGSVSKVDKKSYGISQSVVVKPSVNFAKLEEVLILTESPTAPSHLKK